jgi:hypothetical protein
LEFSILIEPGGRKIFSKECPIPVIADKYWASHAESSKKTASLEGDI